MDHPQGAFEPPRSWGLPARLAGWSYSGAATGAWRSSIEDCGRCGDAAARWDRRTDTRGWPGDKGQPDQSSPVSGGVGRIPRPLLRPSYAATTLTQGGDRAKLRGVKRGSDPEVGVSRKRTSRSIHSGSRPHSVATGLASIRQEPEHYRLGWQDASEILGVGVFPGDTEQPFAGFAARGKGSTSLRSI